MTPETYSYLIANSDENKKPWDTKICVIKEKHKFEAYKHYLEAIQLENKTNQPEKNKVDSLRGIIRNW